MKVKDVETYGSTILVKVPNRKVQIPRVFTVEGEFYKYVKKYEELRPKNVMTDRFFLNHQNGKCTTQVIGKNKFAGFAKQIARFLGLPKAEAYTGHCFRRTSYALLQQAGASRDDIRRHAGLVPSKFYTNEVAVTEESKRITDSIALPSSSMSSIFDPPAEKRPRVENVQDSTADDPLATKSVSSSVNIGHTGASYNIKIPQKNVTLQFVNCSNVTINFSNENNVS